MLRGCLGSKCIGVPMGNLLGCVILGNKCQGMAHMGTSFGNVWVLDNQSCPLGLSLGIKHKVHKQVLFSITSTIPSSSQEKCKFMTFHSLAKKVKLCAINLLIHLLFLLFDLALLYVF